MLHSSFWHHGASDLALPSWWAASASLDHATGDVDHLGRGRATTRSHEGPLLEFLYPEETLALIRRLSKYGADAVEVRRRGLLGVGARRYSTSQWQPSREEPVDDLEAIQAKEEREELLLQSTPDEALRKLLWSSKRGKQELAWQLYSASTDATPPATFLCDLLDYLGDSDFVRTANRILQLFDRIPPENRRSSSYRIAVNAYVALKVIGPAIQLLEEASERFDPTRTGIDAVLKKTIQDDQWDLSIRVFKAFLRWADRENVKVNKWKGYGETHWDNWGPIFGQAQHVLEPVEHLRNFLSHVRQFHHELNSTDENKRALNLFVQGYVPGVMWEVVNTPEPDEDYIYNFFTGLFKDLHALNLPVWALYEYIIPTFLDMPRYQRYTNEDKIFLDLYTTWRQQHLDGYCRPPSRVLINKLIIQHGKHLSYDRVDAMVKDLRSFHAPEPFRVGVLYSLIRFYAGAGLIDRVHEFFEILRTQFPSAVDLRILTSLPYAYARRIDVPGAIEQFKRITNEFKMVPDMSCWNVLLLAFTRADDLDGALECFNNCLESGGTPDIWTFGPMLDLCAARGDVEAFEALFSRAKQLNVPVETDRRARSGYVQAFLNAGDIDGAEQIALGLLQSWKAGTLGNVEITHVWNMLITHHALAGQLADSRRLYQEMKTNSIPLDSWTYGALMRSLVETRQTNAAFKILRVTMPKENVRVYAYHYALCISGFLRENRPDRAKAVYNKMKNVRINQTPSLRQMGLLYTGTRELLKLRAEKIRDPKARLVRVEEELRQNLMSDYGHEIANDEPTLKRYIDSPELSNVPQSYFSVLILLYTTRGALDIAKELFEKASKASIDEQNYSAPIALLTAIMETHYKAGEYDDVERCWELAHREANRLVKTFNQVMHPESPTPEFDSLTDPTVLARFNASRIAINRRQVLFRATRVYIRSLLKQDEPETVQRAQRTVNSLLSNGFIIDNLTWNELIQHLAISNRVADAFSACEMYLMPQFPGWSTLSPVYMRKFRPGYSFMELRHHEVKRGSVLPRYKTLVVLAAAYARVRRDEANGIGFNPGMGGWVREMLEQIAPDTVRAIETMPRTGDELQKEYLFSGM
jgi:pentatricopeptide repeat-containing protein PET309